MQLHFVPGFTTSIQKKLDAHVQHCTKLRTIFLPFTEDICLYDLFSFEPLIAALFNSSKEFVCSECHTITSVLSPEEWDVKLKGIKANHLGFGIPLALIPPEKNAQYGFKKRTVDTEKTRVTIYVFDERRIEEGETKVFTNTLIALSKVSPLCIIYDLPTEKVIREIPIRPICTACAVDGKVTKMQKAVEGKTKDAFKKLPIGEFVHGLLQKGESKLLVNFKEVCDAFQLSDTLTSANFSRLPYDKQSRFKVIFTLFCEPSTPTVLYDFCRGMSCDEVKKVEKTLLSFTQDKICYCVSYEKGETVESALHVKQGTYRKFNGDILEVGTIFPGLYCGNFKGKFNLNSDSKSFIFVAPYQSIPKRLLDKTFGQVINIERPIAQLFSRSPDAKHHGFSASDILKGKKGTEKIIWKGIRYEEVPQTELGRLLEANAPLPEFRPFLPLRQCCDLGEVKLNAPFRGLTHLGRWLTYAFILLNGSAKATPLLCDWIDDELPPEMGLTLWEPLLLHFAKTRAVVINFKYEESYERAIRRQ